MAEDTKTTEEIENTEEVEVNQEPPKMTDISLNTILKKLSEKVSGYNARLLLNHAMVCSGVLTEKEECLNEDNAKLICLELIKKGGPSFQVGKDLYARI